MSLFALHLTSLVSNFRRRIHAFSDGHKVSCSTQVYQRYKMGAFFTSLIKNSAIVGAMLFIYKTLALQPQGTLFNILKSWVLHTTKTDELRRRFLSRDMLVDEGNILMITLFHAPSDPHSTVLLQALKVLVTRYNVHLPKIVSPLLDQGIAGHSAEYKTQWEWQSRTAKPWQKHMD